MHEAGLMRDLIEKVSAVVEEQQARRAVAIEIWLGALSHMSPEHFAEHFATASPGTPAEGARIDIETSDDISHPDAQDILLKSIEVET